MSYALLAESLREIADRAKQFLKEAYGATHFQCEQEVGEDLPLKPTWQATTSDGYQLCLDVRQSLLSPSIHEFVNKCMSRSIPVKLWIVVPETPSGSEPGFAKGLKEAREIGIGVITIPEVGGQPCEYQRPLSLSLVGLRRTDSATVPRNRRETIKKAEDSYFEGSPDEGCRRICEELEAVTRRFAKFTYEKHWWRDGKNEHRKGAVGKKAPVKKKLKERFFTIDPWASMLKQLDERIMEDKVRAKCKPFRQDMIAGARQYTSWRNSVSHTPKTLEERLKRDKLLRTMFEATRDLLLEWYQCDHALKLGK